MTPVGILLTDKNSQYFFFDGPFSFDPSRFGMRWGD